MSSCRPQRKRAGTWRLETPVGRKGHELRTSELRRCSTPDTPPAGDRRRVREDEVWPRKPRPELKREPAAPRPKTGSDLPSAKDILAAVSMRPSAPARKPLDRMNEDLGKPTEYRQPDQWFPHLWLVWPPTVILVIGIGILGSLLSLRWSGDSFNASVVSHRLLTRSENPVKDKPLPESVVPPEPTWWRTTPLHLAEWGSILDARERMTIEPRRVGN